MAESASADEREQDKQEQSLQRKVGACSVQVSDFRWCCCPLPDGLVCFEGCMAWHGE